MKNVVLKTKGNYSMILRQGDDDFKALYVVKNFNPSKEDGQQWDCSEYYGSNAYGGEMNFAAADDALMHECLRYGCCKSADVIPNLYYGIYYATKTEFIIYAETEADAFAKAKAMNQEIGPIEDEDADYSVEPMTIASLSNLLSRRSNAYYGSNDCCIAFDD